MLAIIIYIILSLAPRWVLRKKYKVLESEYSWKTPFFKLVGLLLTFFLAFVLVSWVTMTTTRQFIENKNAVHGFEFSSTMKEFGFQDSMKINTVNGKEVESASTIFADILLDDGETAIVVEKNGIVETIIISENDREELLNDMTNKPLRPIMYDSKGGNESEITEESYGFTEALKEFKLLYRNALFFINPSSIDLKEIGGFYLAGTYDFRAFLIGLSSNLLVIGILNILPLPGFAFGNFLISVIENVRKKLFPKRRKRVVQGVSVLIVVLLLVLRMV